MDLKTIPWALAKGSRDGSSMMMRYRQFKPDFPKQDYPVRVNVVCDFHELTQTGMPTQTEYTQLDIVEDELMGLAEKDDSSVLAMVITSSGKREFIFQTSNAAELYHCVNHAYNIKPRYNIDVSQQKEDYWGLVEDYIPKN